MSSPPEIDDFYIEPLPVERPTLEDLDDDELTSSWTFFLQAIVLLTFGVVGYLFPILLLVVINFAIAITLIAVIQWIHLRTQLRMKFAQKKRSAKREAYRLKVYLFENFLKLERNNGYAQSRLFRLKRTMTKLEKCYGKKQHLAFEREYRTLMIDFSKNLNWLLYCLEEEDKYQELLKGRTHNLPDSLIPLWEIKSIKHDFADLIEKIDGDPTFATIIIILKASDKQLDPERILRKLKWKKRA